MAITTAQSLYYTKLDKDFTAPGEVTTYRLAAAQPAVIDQDANTLHPSAAGTTTITLQPSLSRSVQDDSSANMGWAVNALASSQDAMGSTASALRVIPAGTWNISMGIRVPVAATGTGTLSVTFTVKVYRVSSAGARSLIFSAVSSAIASNGVQAASGYAGASSSQPEVVLQAGETLYCGFLSNCVQVAGLLGAVVAGTINWIVGGGTQSNFIFPAPGVRTRYPQALAESSVAVTDSILTSSLKRRTLTDAAAVTDTLSRTAAYKRTLTDAAAVTDTIKTVSIFNRTLTDNLSGGTTTYVRPVLIFEE